MTTGLITPQEVRTRLGLREPVVQHIAVSEKPWSDYSESDYSLAQWHAACLIHQHDGPPTSKAQCKLPVRTPDGILNRAGVHAAAAALAGARGGVQASNEQKVAAAKALVRCYAQLDEKPPPSMMQSAIERTDAFLTHFGIRGMKWGVRRSRGPGGTVSSGIAKPKAGEPDEVAAIKQKAASSGFHSLTNNEMSVLVNRMNLQTNYAKMTARPSKLEVGRKFIDNQLKNGKTINEMMTFYNSPAGKLLTSAISNTSAGAHTKGKTLQGKHITR